MDSSFREPTNRRAPIGKDITQQMIRVVVADDHPMMRTGIRTMLEAEEDIHVIAEAANGLEAFRLVTSLGPDVLLLDMEMPGLSGVEVARKIKAENLPVQILALSAYDDESYVNGLLETGAAGYITKEKPPSMIIEAVRAVSRGEGRWFVSPIHKSGDFPVSEREQDVLKLMAQGYSNQQISEFLFISENTVRNHVANIYSKLGVNTWREAVAWAWQEGLMKNT